jgi:NADH-quinone oxidoreductase E subunit
METMKVEFSEEAKRELEETLAHYPDRTAATMPALMLAMREFGFVDEEVCDYLSGLTGISPIHGKDTASFYPMFRPRGTGKYVIMVCHTLSCALLGAADIVEHLKKRLGIDAGETTPDKKFTLVKVECLGSCGTAPVISINGTYHENLTIERLDEILDNLE